MTDLSDAVAVLRQGGVVACPTETLVGLLADGTNPRAVDRVIAIKGRLPEQPIGVLVADLDAATEIADLNEHALALAKRAWPGPLTLVARATVSLPSALTLDGKVGVRVPGPSVALELARAVGHPLTATSANVTGEPSVTNTADLSISVRQSVDAIVEGRAGGGLPSTVVDVACDPPVVLRQGAFTAL